MSRRNQRVPVHLSPAHVRALPDEDIRLILRGADDLIMSGGRSLLTKVLKGSRAQDVLQLKLDQSPVYGVYQGLPADEVLARIDWLITHGYLRIEYSGKLPLLIYTAKGWGIEIETFTDELLHGFDQRLAAEQPPWDMTYLKDRSREMIWLLLEAWAQVDYQKVRQRIRQVIEHLKHRRN